MIRTEAEHQVARRRLNQRELAARLSVSEAVVSRDEHNEYHGITMNRAQRILDALLSPPSFGLKSYQQKSLTS